MTDPLHRIMLRKPASLSVATKALVDHGFTPWSFWDQHDGEDYIFIQFHAPREVNLDFLRPMILPPREKSDG